MALLLFAFFGASCTAERDGAPGPVSEKQGEVHYAKLFSLSRNNNGCTVARVFRPGPSGSVLTFTYLLVPEGKRVPRHDPDVIVVRTPLKTVTCESGFQVSLLELLGCDDALVGVSGMVRIGQDSIHEKIRRGELSVTGLMRSMNMEMLVKLDPNMVFINMSGAAPDIPEKLQTYGLTPAVFSASLEEHPLAALEWIKFVGAFFEKDRLADTIFRDRERAYLEMQKKVSGVGNRPSVIAGYSRGGSWSTMGSSPWFVAMLDHAGADYLFKGDALKRGHLLSHEAAFSAGMKADFWVNTYGSAKQIADVVRHDSRYELFPCVRSRQVFNNNGFCFENGRSRFWDTGMTEPHLILADLIALFHPERMPGHELKYYRKLE